MQMSEAAKLRKAWGDKPCLHPELDREYDKGIHTGDVVCTTCGEDFPSRVAAARDRDEHRQRLATADPPA